MRPKDALSFEWRVTRSSIVAMKDEARAGAEARLVKAKQKADAASTAMAEYTATAAATASKTARLRALRLAKEAAEREAEPVKKAPRKKRPSS